MTDFFRDSQNITTTGKIIGSPAEENQQRNKLTPEILQRIQI
jgi:hypothetical protein